MYICTHVPCIPHKCVVYLQLILVGWRGLPGMIWEHGNLPFHWGLASQEAAKSLRWGPHLVGWESVPAPGSHWLRMIFGWNLVENFPCGWASWWWGLSVMSFLVVIEAGGSSLSIWGRVECFFGKVVEVLTLKGMTLGYMIIPSKQLKGEAFQWTYIHIHKTALF